MTAGGPAVVACVRWPMRAVVPTSGRRDPAGAPPEPPKLAPRVSHTNTRQIRQETADIPLPRVQPSFLAKQPGGSGCNLHSKCCYMYM